MSLSSVFCDLWYRTLNFMFGLRNFFENQKKQTKSDKIKKSGENEKS